VVRDVVDGDANLDDRVQAGTWVALLTGLHSGGVHLHIAVAVNVVDHDQDGQEG
jgi:hypothetical protein